MTLIKNSKLIAMNISSFYDPNSYPLHSLENEEILSKLIDAEGNINQSIRISGKQITKLKKVKRIKGSLLIIDSTIESLGSLEEVWGELRVNTYFLESKLNSLGNLNFVQNEVSLHYSKIRDLSVLRRVGGDLRLPKYLDGKIDKSILEVGGSIRFLNIKENSFNEKIWLKTIKYSKQIPFWQNQYISDTGFFKSSNSVLEKATNIQKEFYHFFKQNFLNGIFYDIEGNTNYLYLFYFEIMRDKSSLLEVHLENLRDYYYQYIGNFIDGAVLEQKLNLLKRSGSYEKAMNLELENAGFSVSDVVYYIRKIGLIKLTPQMLIKILWATTENYSKSKINKLLKLIEPEINKYENEIGSSFFLKFFDNDLNIISKDNKIDLDYYAKFFPDSFNYYVSIDTSNGVNSHLIDKAHLSHVFEKSIWFELKKILATATRQLLKMENPDEFIKQEKKKKRKLENEQFRKSKLYDCKEQKLVTLKEINSITGKKISMSIFKTKKSLYGRFILFDNKESNRVFNQWKTVVDEQTTKVYRFNLESFADFVGVDSKSVWGFFNGRQKMFHKRYKIISNE